MMALMELSEGARVRHSSSGREATVVRRMPANTAPGREHEEAEPVYELDDGSLAPAGTLVALEPAAEVAPAAAHEE